jgi:isopentenyl-diphosphate delta-isomerase
LSTKETSNRKTDHIELAFASQVAQFDTRFYYEPLLSAHPDDNTALPTFELAGKNMLAPIWVSSMTGGAEKAGIINKNLARACAEFGLGMGLGSCRIILEDNTHLNDFKLRSIIGNDLPFFSNLGIAQLEELFASNKAHLIQSLIDRTETDGLIIHVNPMQEWLQPEGDHFYHSPLDTIKRTLDILDKPIIVKEVGQGMGPKSLNELMQLPLEAIDFGALGGTNFALLEILRADEAYKESFEELSHIGHSAQDMCQIYNGMIEDLGEKWLCKKVIISGGIKGFLDGYYLTNIINTKAAYGQASSFLKQAQGDYKVLQRYVSNQIKGLKLAQTYLSIRQ